VIRVAIIGAGLGGLAAAVKLRQRTSADFVIFEQSDGVGGTWRDNRYPGCEVDIHSHAYSYSFLRYEWPRTHATQPELLAYAEHVVTVFGLAPHLRLNTRVTTLAWEETAARYRSEPAHDGHDGEGTQELAERAKEAEHERDTALARYHNYEFASAAFQIGIVLCSAAIITGMAILVWVAGGLAVVGLTFISFGLLAPHLLHLG